MAGMSPAALARCKRLVIRSISEDESYRVALEVFDPRGGAEPRKVDEYVSRTPQDTARVRAAFMRKHRVPSQNVTETVDGDRAN